MDDRKIEIIKQLMSELEDLMGPSADDFSERLGKPKPAVVEMSIEGEEPDEDMGEEMEMGPEDKLKQRLMKMRGE